MAGEIVTSKDKNRNAPIKILMPNFIYESLQIGINKIAKLVEGSK